MHREGCWVSRKVDMGLSSSGFGNGWIHIELFVEHFPASWSFGTGQQNIE